MMNKLKQIDNRIIRSLFAGKMGDKYFGKHVVVTGSGQVHILPSDGKDARLFLDDLKRKNPAEDTELMFVPRPETYILSRRI